MVIATQLLVRASTSMFMPMALYMYIVMNIHTSTVTAMSTDTHMIPLR